MGWPASRPARTQFYGRIDNIPQHDLTVSVGQQVDVEPEEIADWMYIEDGRLVGGETTRVLYESFSPEERAEFERMAPFTIQ